MTGEEKRKLKKKAYYQSRREEIRIYKKAWNQSHKEALDNKGVIDHDHITDKIRGILCRSCNLRLSGIEDSKFNEKAINYLKPYKEELIDE